MRMRNEGAISHVLIAVLLAGAAPVALMAAAPVKAQEMPTVRAYQIPAQPLASALTKFGQQSGLQVSVSSATAKGRTSPGISGTLSADQALSQLLAGTGASFRFSGNDTVIISASEGAGNEAGAIVDGAIALDTIDVSGGTASASEGYTPDTPYETAASVSHISAENIERFRGSSPADIFRGTAGVMSGEARNGAGSVDVNIRGMQGMGRVATTIDGAENNVTVYQGYQGLSNRTFVDPDFIGGVDITKGADASSWGNAGSVAMRTLSADDIVRPGDKWGVRVKGGFGTNTSQPVAGALSGYDISNPVANSWVVTPSPTGLDRPSAISPTSGSGSVVAAYKGDSIDMLAGYAYRERGNYHAGTRGPVAKPVGTGPVVNAGLANIRAGEEVLNTQLRTESWLTKLTARLSEDQTLQLGYTGFRSEAGDRIASLVGDNAGQFGVQKGQTAGTSLDTYTARYRWDPTDNDLIDFRSNFYWSHLELRNPVRGSHAVKPVTIGLPANIRSGSDSDMWGGDISNLSKFEFDFGKLNITNGFSYRAEDTRGSRHAEVLEEWLTPRDAIRHEIAGFTKVAYSPIDWLTLNGGLRYSHFWTKDRVEPYVRSQIALGSVTPGFKLDDGGFSPTAGVTLEPLAGTQIYVNYSNTLRAPSIIESGSAFNSVTAHSGVQPERSNNWEIGANLSADGVFATDDRSMIKLGYFNWNVQDYLARNIQVVNGNPTLNIENIDRARFEGLEFSGRYEQGGFTADLAANYFLNVEYCRTADTCGAKTLYGDYATNHVQPKYSLDLTVAQKLFDDQLTVGGRVSYVGPRAIGHGDVTGKGASEFIKPIIWEPYTLVDLFSEYKITDSLTAALRVENVFDQFYVDPLSLIAQPGPGRTFYASFTKTFGGDDTLPELPSLFTHAPTDASGRVDWGGLYAGFHAGAGLAHTWGTTTAANGAPHVIAATESADMNFDSGMFGLQAGYNWQLGNGLVIGLEADWSKTYMQGTNKVRSTEGTLASAGAVQAAIGYNIDWTSSLRGRVGYALSDKWLMYGTAGVSMLRETQSREQYRSTNNPSSSLGTETKVVNIESDAKNRFGFTLGGGAEYAINDHWSIKADYAYTRFNKKSFAFGSASAGAAQNWTESRLVRIEVLPALLPPNHPLCTQPVPNAVCFEREFPIYEHTNHQGSADEVNGRSANNALDMHTLKLGINYRF